MFHFLARRFMAMRAVGSAKPDPTEAACRHQTQGMVKVSPSLGLSIAEIWEAVSVFPLAAYSALVLVEKVARSTLRAAPAVAPALEVQAPEVQLLTMVQ
jgi:hypothetical protein